MLGGYIQKAWGWREAFFIGGGPGVVLALLCLVLDEPKRKLAAARDATMASVMRVLAKIKQYRRAVLGYCAHTASIGAFAYWAPKFLSARFGDQFQAPFEALQHSHDASLPPWWGAYPRVFATVLERRLRANVERPSGEWRNGRRARFRSVCP